MTRAHALEVIGLTLLAAGLAAAMPLTTGYWGWSWDALNHHIYLGMIAEHPRWDLDVIPASYQSYQYPYLYWPVYRLSLWNVSGAVAGALWAAIQAGLLLPPVWLISYRLLPERPGANWQGCIERIAGCLMAAMSIVLWSALETTSNDLLAAVPFLWAVAMALAPAATGRRMFAVGVLYGISVAFKLSNALFVPMLLVWWWQPIWPFLPLRRGAQLLLASALGFVAAYAPWGLQLWQLTGNPFYPFLGR